MKLKKIVIIATFALVNLSHIQQTNGISKEKRKGEVASTDNVENTRVVTKSFRFDTNSFIYCDQNYIEKFAILLEDYPDISIKLTGHCTNTEYNQNPSLSKLRVRNIANLICLMGFEKNKVEVEDLKNTQPIEATGNDIINQRVELILVD